MQSKLDVQKADVLAKAVAAGTHGHDKSADPGKLKTFPFADRAKLLQLAEPVKQSYAKEVDAVAILNRVNAIK